MKVPSIILKTVFLVAIAVFMVKGYDLESPALGQELQFPPGPRLSTGIVRVGRTPAARIEEGKQVGLIWFDNDLAVPSTGAPMGTQTATVSRSVPTLCWLATFALIWTRLKGRALSLLRLYSIWLSSPPLI
ncbi:hypothetical protein IV203_003653 [Nitzschia inconspicua]|uniref:Uncharacterized protein n=1 Tax=Nitzschia inconspicua TaxID=303405 RepID=A0A9K3PNY0_9STRA|nr:hypothetical protein IV203_003653 [Nitzschia inconspicua]